jgi:hypothetical protein
MEYADARAALTARSQKLPNGFQGLPSAPRENWSTCYNESRGDRLDAWQLAVRRASNDPRIPAPIKRWLKAGKITADDVHAVWTLLQDIDTATTRHSGDQADLMVPAANQGAADADANGDGSDDGSGDMDISLQRIEQNPLDSAIRCKMAPEEMTGERMATIRAVLGIKSELDPDGLHRSLFRRPYAAPGEYDGRALQRATVTARVLAAKRAVDDAVQPGTCKSLVHYAMGVTLEDLAGRDGDLPGFEDPTFGQGQSSQARTLSLHILAGIRALRRHYIAAARQPKFAVWRDAADAAGGNWRDQPSWLEVVQRCQRAGPSMSAPCGANVYQPGLRGSRAADWRGLFVPVGFNWRRICPKRIETLHCPGRRRVDYSGAGTGLEPESADLAEVKWNARRAGARKAVATKAARRAAREWFAGGGWTGWADREPDIVDVIQETAFPSRSALAWDAELAARSAADEVAATIEDECFPPADVLAAE